MIAVALALLLAPAPRIDLQWSAPPRCPQRDEVAARAEQLLLTSDAQLVARGRIVGTSQGDFVLELAIVRATETITHRHRAEDCTTLAGVAALLVAVSADPVVVSEPIAELEPIVDVPAPPAETPAHATRATKPPPPVVTSPPSPSQRRRRALGGWIRVAGIVGFAQLPTIDAGLGLTGALVIDRFRVELGVAHLFARTRELPGLAPARAVLSAWNASLRGCGELGPRRIRIGACIGPEIGAVVATAEGVDVPRPNAGPWVALLVGPALRWRPIDRVQIHLAVDSVIALARPGFALAGDAEPRVLAGAGGVRTTLGVAIGLGRAEIHRASPRR